MELNAVSPNAGASLLSAVNPNLQQERQAAQRAQPQAEEARQSARAQRQAPQRAARETQESRQAQETRQTPETEAADRLREDQRARPTVNAEGQLVGRRVNITA
jgi:hypothetical protein